MRDAAPHLAPVEGAGGLDPLFERSHHGPVLLFLDAPSCPIGRAAYREMARSGVAAAMINVERQRDLTRAVERRTGVRHESPQVLLLRDGEAVWDASHDDITAETVQAALRRAAEPAGVRHAAPGGQPPAS